MLQKGLFLLEHERWQEALEQFQLHLAQEPEDPHGLAWSAVCLLRLKQLAPAEESARRAIAADPDLAYPHYVLGLILQERNRTAAALEAVQTACQLEPAAAYFGLASAIQAERKCWTEAQALAERGLELEPHHNLCVNARARALAALGTAELARCELENQLQEYPEDARTHANLGWLALERGDREAALRSFQEALRLDPELRWAREGLLQALKLKYPFYRWMFAYMLWMSRQTGKRQIRVILGSYLAYRCLLDLSRDSAAVRFWATPFLVVYGVFAYLTWTKRPLTNLLLRFNRYGRRLLGEEETRETNLVGACWLVALVGGIAWGAGAAWGQLVFLLGIVQAPLVASRLGVEAGWPRRVVTAAGLLVATLGFGSLLLMAAGFRAGLTLIELYTPALLISLVGANLLSGFRPNRS